jgi:hypothetical protein
MPDVLAGYGKPGEGVLVQARSNMDAIYPNSPKAQARRLTGAFPSDGLLPMGVATGLLTAPDFLACAD